MPANITAEMAKNLLKTGPSLFSGNFAGRTPPAIDSDFRTAS
jgi:hypothetical protein